MNLEARPASPLAGNSPPHHGGHYIQIDRPDLLNSQVANLIRQIRGEASPSIDYDRYILVRGILVTLAKPDPKEESL